MDELKKHKKNGLVQNKIMLSSGFSITTSIATGIAGESTCLIISDNNIYPDSDSRSKRHFEREYIIPIDYTDDLKKIVNSINESLKVREKTLIKK